VSERSRHDIVWSRAVRIDVSMVGRLTSESPTAHSHFHGSHWQRSGHDQLCGRHRARRGRWSWCPTPRRDTFTRRWCRFLRRPQVGFSVEAVAVASVDPKNTVYSASASSACPSFREVQRALLRLPYGLKEGNNEQAVSSDRIAPTPFLKSLACCWAICASAPRCF